jgi:hypothetical protein
MLAQPVEGEADGLGEFRQPSGTALPINPPNADVSD